MIADIHAEIEAIHQTMMDAVAADLRLLELVKTLTLERDEARAECERLRQDLIDHAD